MRETGCRWLVIYPFNFISFNLSVEKHSKYKCVDAKITCLEEEAGVGGENHRGTRLARSIMKEPRRGVRSLGLYSPALCPIVRISVAFDQQPGQRWFLDMGFATVSTMYAGQIQD